MTDRLTPAQVRKLTHRAKASALEDRLAARIGAEGLPAPLREYRFCSRRWRFDFAWPEQLLAVEVEGGTYSGGRHTRPEGFERDCEKYNAAALDGWRVLRVTGRMVRDGRALVLLRRALGAP